MFAFVHTKKLHENKKCAKKNCYPINHVIITPLHIYTMFKNLITKEESYWNHSHAMLVTMHIYLSLSPYQILTLGSHVLIYQVAPLVIIYV